MPLLLCDACGKSFNKRFNLNRHYVTCHVDSSNDSKCTLTCDICRQNFTTRFSLKRHFTRNSCHRPSLKCALCQELCINFHEFSNHIQIKHGIATKSEKLHFLNESDFFTWMSTTEKEERVSYIKTQSGKQVKTVVFQCHRSGYAKLVSPADRKREVKIQGSCKINAYCPSRVKALFKTDGSVNVEYCKTHVGHENDLVHLHLSYEDRKEIASHIVQKIPYENILQNIQSKAISDKLQRRHLISRQDLYNIKREYALNINIVRRSNDAVSLDAFVENEKSSDLNCVLLYKPQNVFMPEFPSLRKKDFAIGIMMEAQEVLIKKYGSDCICVDNTNGMNAFGFEMAVVLVLDDMRECFPCAFFISNRMDEDALQVFFTAIKDKVGEIQCNIFMSDMAENFFNAWQNVMGKPDKRLFCTWHVLQAWEKQLNKKISNVGKRKDIKDMLSGLLKETDEVTFLKMLRNLLLILKNDESTKDFYMYFEKYYVSNCSSWAYCYHMHAGLNTNIHLERMHRTIKYLYLRGKTAKRINKAIYALVEYMKRKLLDRLLVLEKGKVTTKLRIIRSRHLASLTMDTTSLVADGDSSWAVCSSSSKMSRLYTVTLAKQDCQCRLICRWCNTCFHKYCCTCIDYSVRYNMCKHVHLLCRALPNLQSENRQKGELLQGSSTQSYNLEIEEDPVSEEENAILEVMSDEDNLSSLAEIKTELRQQCLTFIDSLSSVKEVCIFKKLLNNAIDSRKKHRDPNTLEKVFDIPGIEPRNVK